VSYSHTPVLLDEVVEFLNPKSGGIYFDGTLGGGGYAEKILQKGPNDCKVIGADIDEDAITAAREKLGDYGDRAVIIKESYSNITGIAEEFSARFDGAVLDLGVSNNQLREARRGFSFKNDGPLDMRMNLDSEVDAATIVNSWGEEDLAKIFWELGEERFSRRIAKEILRFRQTKRIENTRELSRICSRVYGSKRGRIDPATRVFQALRIAVNGELENLKRFLDEAPAIMGDEGCLVIVSYHSLEDRMVKVRFKELAKGGDFRILTKRPVTASDAEIKNNPGSRSAKLRAIIRKN